MKYVRLFFLVLSLVLASTPAYAASVSLQWDYDYVASPDAVKFVIYRQQSCTGSFAAIGIVMAPSQTYSDTAVVRGQTYCWYATAKDTAGQESGPSNTVMFQVPQSLAPPSNLRGTVNP